MVNARFRDELIEAAKRGMQNAYAVVNNFPVGAAVLTAKAKIYQGCNTQSVISGMGVCAERSAIDHAVACGEYLFEAIAVTSQLDTPIAPCGMCLQYIGEFSQIAQHDIDILMIGSTGKVNESSVYKMLPVIFGPLDLNLDVSRYRK
jgi:cytidine deaminase